MLEFCTLLEKRAQSEKIDFLKRLKFVLAVCVLVTPVRSVANVSLAKHVV